MPYVKWMLGAEDLTPEDDMPIGRNVLELTDVRQSNNYTCVAMSTLGVIEAVAQIIVKGGLIRMYMRLVGEERRVCEEERKGWFDLASSETLVMTLFKRAKGTLQQCLLSMKAHLMCSAIKREFPLQKK